MFSYCIQRGGGVRSCLMYAWCTVIANFSFLAVLHSCCVKSSTRGGSVIIVVFVVHGRGRHRGFPAGSTRMHVIYTIKHTW